MILDNSPALGWIRITNAVVTYRNKLYVIPDDCTEKKYVYWDSENPANYEKTNVIHPETDTKFLILINDKGMHTIVESKTDFFNIAFDSGIQAKVEQKIFGMYEDYQDKQGENEKKFSSITQNIDDITQLVGKVSKDSKTNYSEIRQKTDSIELEVRETEQTLVGNMLRDKVVGEYLLTMEFLGRYEIVMQNIMRDEKLDSKSTTNSWDLDTHLEEIDFTDYEKLLVNVNEKQQIQIHNKVLKHRIEKLNEALKEIEKDTTMIENSKGDLSIISKEIIPTMNSKIDKLIEIINTACLDNIFDSTEIIIIYNNFQDILGTLNRNKTTIDNLITLGYGGNVVNTVGKIFLDKDKGGFSFTKEINENRKKITEISAGIDGLGIKIGTYGEVAEELKDNINTVTNEIDGKIDEQNKNIKKQMEFIGTEINVTREMIESKVSNSDFQSRISQLNNEISSKISNISSSTSSEIRQLQNEISSKVSNSQFGTLVKQSSEAIKVAINNIGDTGGLPNFVFDSNGLTINRGHIAVDSLTVPEGSSPYIKLYRSIYTSNGGTPAIDATRENNQGIGNSIRFKWDDANYIKVMKNQIDFFINSSKYNTNPVYTFCEDYIKWDGDRIYKNELINNGITQGTNGSGVKKITFRIGSDSVDLYENGDVWINGSNYFRLR